LYYFWPIIEKWGKNIAFWLTSHIWSNINKMKQSAREEPRGRVLPISPERR
jgi:hypothetical protein